MCTQSSTLYKNKLNHSVGCKYSKVIRFWFPLQNTILYEVVIESTYNLSRANIMHTLLFTR